MAIWGFVAAGFVEPVVDGEVFGFNEVAWFFVGVPAVPVPDVPGRAEGGAERNNSLL